VAPFPASCEECPVETSDGIGGSGSSPHALDLDIAEDEAVSAIRKMHRGKPGGIDGITTEFSLCIRHVIALFSLLFNKMFSGGISR
jgi:hypothetical protein